MMKIFIFSTMIVGFFSQAAPVCPPGGSAFSKIQDQALLIQVKSEMEGLPKEDSIDEFVNDICYSPFGGRKSLTDASEELMHRKEPAAVVLKKYHDKVQCNDLQRPVDFDERLVGYYAISRPACVYEGLVDLEKMKVSGFSAKKVNLPDVRDERLMMVGNAVATYEVTDSKGNRRYYLLETTKGGNVMYQKTGFGQGIGGQGVANKEYFTFAYASLTEVIKTPTGKFVIRGSGMYGGGYGSSGVCYFPYAPEGS